MNNPHATVEYHWGDPAVTPPQMVPYGNENGRALFAPPHSFNPMWGYAEREGDRQLIMRDRYLDEVNHPEKYRRPQIVNEILTPAMGASYNLNNRPIDRYYYDYKRSEIPSYMHVNLTEDMRRAKMLGPRDPRQLQPWGSATPYGHFDANTIDLEAKEIRPISKFGAPIRHVQSHLFDSGDKVTVDRNPRL